jgi:uncharacterized membrane protein YhaH (DUF805 family)
LLLVAVALAGLPLVAAAAPKPSDAHIDACRVGFAGVYKVGYWTPISVDVVGAGGLGQAPAIHVTVNDNDGVATTVSAPAPVTIELDKPATVLLTTQIGRMGSEIRVELACDGESIDQIELKPGPATAGEEGLAELPATSELVIALSAPTYPWGDLLPNRRAENGQVIRRTVQLDRVEALPTKWFDYEAVDVLLIAADDSSLWRDLAADKTRYAALVQWVELGGRLVVMCGGDSAEALLKEGGSLAGLVPGRLAGVVRLPETGPLESFVDSKAPIGNLGARIAIRVPQLADVDGYIEVFGGRGRPTELPLVVRSARGLGEITFVGVDLTKPPLAEWTGRADFLKAVLRPYLAGEGISGATQKLVTRGYNDLSGALRQRMGRSFTGVAPVAFSLVTLFAVAYLLVLGPLDYFVVRRWFKRSFAAWFTFPLIVLLFGGMALAIADWRQGSGGLRVNQIELVDIDAGSGVARGTVWSAVYSPTADRLDVRLDVELLANQDENERSRLHSWSLPGVGIGGTQSGGLNLAITGGGYRYVDDSQKLEGVPILTAGTKSLLARWTATVGPLVVADLSDEDGLVTGSIENRTGRTLRNVRLFYNESGYRLDTLTDGARIGVGEFSPRNVKTIVTQDSLGSAERKATEGNVFAVERASLKEIMNVMMFYEATGGLGFAQLPNRFQAYCDLSRLPSLGRAVLVADVETAGSRLVNAESGEGVGEEHSAAVIYRFVLPVRSE